MTTQAKVLLLTLSERTSARGNTYLSGWLGRASVVAFRGEAPDKFGNPTWDLFVSTPDPRAARAANPTHVSDSDGRQQANGHDRGGEPARHVERRQPRQHQSRHMRR